MVTVYGNIPSVNSDGHTYVELVTPTTTYNQPTVLRSLYTTTVTSASSARTATGSASLGAMAAGTSKLVVTINVTAVSGTTPTLIFSLKQNDANGNSVLLCGTTSHTPVVGQYILTVGKSIPALSGGAPVAGIVSSTTGPGLLSDTGAVTLSWTIGGTAPSYTFQYAAQPIQE